MAGAQMPDELLLLETIPAHPESLRGEDVVIVELISLESLRHVPGLQVKSFIERR